MIRAIVRCFLTGLLTLLPLIVTCALVAWIANLLKVYLGPETMIGKGLTELGIQLNNGAFYPYLLGWLIVLFLIFLFGILMNIGLHRYWELFFDEQMKRVPLVGQIYDTTSKLMNLLKKDGNEEMQNMKPVYCRMGNAPGTLLLALMSLGDEFLIDGEAYRIVVVPTAPIPFGGAMLLVPSKDVFPAEMSLDTFMNFYVSMGVTAEQSLEKVKRQP
ncbi:MAG: DUF502 domain-containing protein [Planctomycetia bacterium]|nr:DUF502 domain-containing protein [Planctomycetia bacterium]